MRGSESNHRACFSVHVVIVVLDFGQSSLAEGVRGRSVQDLVHPVISSREHAQLQLLLLLLHLVLALEEELGDLGERLFHRHVPEVSLLDFIPGELTAASSGATVVLIAGASRLNHPESGSPHDVVAGQDDRRAVRALVRVNSVHLRDVGQSLSDDLARDLNAKVVMVLLGLFSATVHQSPAIWHESVHNL